MTFLLINKFVLNLTKDIMSVYGNLMLKKAPSLFRIENSFRVCLKSRLTKRIIWFVTTAVACLIFVGR